MKFNLKKLMKRQDMRILGVAAAANFILLSYVNYSMLDFDIIGLVSYLIIALGIGYVFKQKKMDLMTYAMFGFAAPIVYNLVFSTLNFFQFDLILSLKGGVQQAVITAIVAKLWGVKK